RREIFGDLDRLDAARSLDDGSTGLRRRRPHVRSRRRRRRRARRDFGDSDRNVADGPERAQRLDRAGRNRRWLLSDGRFRLGLLRGQSGGVLVLGGGVRLLAAEDDAAAGRLGRLDLGTLLTFELLDDRERLVVLERG